MASLANLKLVLGIDIIAGSHRCHGHILRARSDATGASQGRPGDSGEGSLGTQAGGWMKMRIFHVFWGEKWHVASGKLAVCYGARAIGKPRVCYDMTHL